MAGAGRGITVSGGEPFEQFAALLALLGELRQRSRADILVYSGYPLEHLHAQLEQAAGLIDALISDPTNSTPNRAWPCAAATTSA